MALPLALHEVCGTEVHACGATTGAKTHPVLVIWAVVALMPETYTLPVPAALMVRSGEINPGSKITEPTPFVLRLDSAVGGRPIVTLIGSVATTAETSRPRVPLFTVALMLFVTSG